MRSSCWQWLRGTWKTSSKRERTAISLPSYGRSLKDSAFGAPISLNTRALRGSARLSSTQNPCAPPRGETYFRGPLHSHELIGVAAEFAWSDTPLGPARFPDTDDDRYRFAAENDLLQCVIVPIHLTVAGPIGSWASADWANSISITRLALQLLSYNLFARTRAFEKFVQDNTPQPLSPREKTVVGMSADGLTSVEIAEALRLSARTVNQYVDNVARKLGTRNRAHAVAEVIRRRLVE